MVSTDGLSLNDRYTGTIIALLALLQLPIVAALDDLVAGAVAGTVAGVVADAGAGAAGAGAAGRCALGCACGCPSTWAYVGAGAGTAAGCCWLVAVGWASLAFGARGAIFTP